MHKFSALLLASLVAAFVITAQADGPADNIPEKVRPVPPTGGKIPDEARAELLAGADRLAGEIVNLRGEFKAKSNVLALLPDIQIYEKAVRWAVQYDEMFSPSNEIAAARTLLADHLFGGRFTKRFLGSSGSDAFYKQISRIFGVRRVL